MLIMSDTALVRYFKGGVRFLREHPQLWLTGAVGLCIVCSFLFVAWRFATIAQEAQEQLVHVRIGSILDAFVLFAPDVLEESDTLRNHMDSILASNPTIRSFTIYGEHGNNAWRVYISKNGPREGTVIETVPVAFSLAWSDPGNAYTFETVGDDGRQFVTARAMVRSDNTPIALAVTEQGMAAFDAQIAQRIRDSMIVLFVVLAFITLIFFRHARIVDFAVLYKKQLEVDEMKDNFISMASHELKSPLSVIRGYIEFLKDSDSAKEARDEYLRRIDVSALELSHLVEDILDVSRIEMGRLRFSPDYVSVDEVLTDVVEMFSSQASEQGLTLSLEVSDTETPVYVLVDRGRLKQAIINLLSNAIKYTPEGAVTVSRVCVGEYVELSVRDTGIGMSAQEQKKLFGKFQRIENDESKHVSGTGLGLWITKYIVEHMKGEITVESIKGQGTRFVLRFPIRKKLEEKHT